jgi:hypothetical protein
LVASSENALVKLATRPQTGWRFSLPFIALPTLEGVPKGVVKGVVGILLGFDDQGKIDEKPRKRLAKPGFGLIAQLDRATDF